MMATSFRCWIAETTGVDVGKRELDSVTIQGLFTEIRSTSMVCRSPYSTCMQRSWTDQIRLLSASSAY